MEQASNTSVTRETSKAFQKFEEKTLAIVEQGLALAGRQEDKLFKCLCNSIVWALEGAARQEFKFDLNSKKAFEANLAKKPVYAERSALIDKIDLAVTEESVAIAAAGCDAEVIAINLVSALTKAFREDRYTPRANTLFLAAQAQVSGSVPEPDNISALEQIGRMTQPAE